MSNKNNNKKNSRKPSKARSETVNAPVAVGIIARPSAPVFGSKDGVRIHRREFVGTATNGATTGFALTAISQAVPGYDLNPSVNVLFPWLSNIANCYERFRFNKLCFEFIPSQASSTAGRYYAAVDYDYDDAVASSKQALMGNITGAEAAVWQPCKLVCDPKSLNRDLPYRYVSCTSRGLAVEQRTAYAGFLMVAFDTPTANLSVDIWVDYDVDLVTPVNDHETLQNNFCTTTGGTYVSAVTVAQGTTFAANPPITNTTRMSGPVTPVKAGSPGVPVFSSVVGGNGWAPTNALDIIGMRGTGSLDLNVILNQNASTPATLLTTNLVNTAWQIFDHLGTYLGQVTDVLSARVVAGANAVSEMATNAKFVNAITSVAMQALIDTYPTARYLAPLLLSDVVVGAGYSGHGYFAHL